MVTIPKTYHKICRAALALFASVAVLAVVAISLAWFEQKRNADEEYKVYSAYLSDGLLNDTHDWSVGGPIQVVIEDATTSGRYLRWWGLYVLDGRVRFDQLQASTRASYLLRNLLRSRIQCRFTLLRRATVVLASPSETQAWLEAPPEFQKKFPRNMGLVSLSGVGFNPSRTQAVFYIDHFCGLCGGGRYVLMEKVNGS